MIRSRNWRRGLLPHGAWLCLLLTSSAAAAAPPRPGATMDQNKTKPSPESLKARLSELQYRVTQEEGTEPPFANAYWDHKQEGIYVDVVSGEVLFSSRDKYDSGSGWPSFTRPLEPANLLTRSDHRLGMTRTEVRSRGGGSHLGHLFDDGPASTGQRYCINSAALRFIPRERLAAEGYGAYASQFSTPPADAGRADASQRPAAGPTDARQCAAAGPASPPPAGGAAADKERTAGDRTPVTQTAILAAGCFWGAEELLRQLPGVIDTAVGYTGGRTANPTYPEVRTGSTGHAEAVKVTFDPTRITYEAILNTFFRLHDPTTPNQQGNDRGTQYRSAIFFLGPEQQRIAAQVKDRVNRAGRWRGRVVTEIVPATTFYPAEDYHQDYLQKHPEGYTCHFLRD